MSAIKFIQIIARKKAAEQGGKGITTIANKMQAEAKAAEIAETFRASGLTPDKWDDFIKSEKDVTKYLNIIESTRKQAIEQATKKSKDILKVTKKKERPFTGWTPKVVERSMSADDYAALKEEWFSRIMTNTDEALNTFLKRGINASDERFKNFTPKQRKDFLEMVDYRLKHGNEKFMNDLTDAKGKFKLPEDLAYGGIAGGGLAPLLGEPTYQDEEHRVPFSRGKKVWDILNLVRSKFGPKSVTTADKLTRPTKAIETENLSLSFDRLNNKIATQEALAKGSEKMAGPIKTKNKGAWDPESTDATPWLQQEKFF